MFEQFVRDSHGVVSFANVMGHKAAANTFEIASDMVVDLVYQLMAHPEQRAS